MKRKYLALLLSLAIMLTLAACGNKTPDESSPSESPSPVTLSGEYVLTVYEINGEDMLEFFAFMAGDEFEPNSLFIDFRSGGKCVLVMADEPEEYTYKIDGNKVTLNIDGDIMVAKNE